MVCKNPISPSSKLRESPDTALLLEPSESSEKPNSMEAVDESLKAKKTGELIEGELIEAVVLFENEKKYSSANNNQQEPGNRHNGQNFHHSRSSKHANTRNLEQKKPSKSRLWSYLKNSSSSGATTSSSATSSNNPNYRPDIDGLRAIAVWLVIGEHVGWKKQFPYGFLGVDIFFVISGYLITGLLYRDIVTKRSYTDVIEYNCEKTAASVEEKKEGIEESDAEKKEGIEESDAEKKEGIEETNAEKKEGIEETNAEKKEGIDESNAEKKEGIDESNAEKKEGIEESEAEKKEGIEESDAEKKEGIEESKAEKKKKQIPKKSPETMRSILRMFYLRRVRRIAPALLTMIFINFLLLMVFFLPHSILESVLYPINATILCCANLYFNFFIKGSGYWGNNAAIEPFLHMWSLSLEEQFYFVWPWIMFGVDKIARIVTPFIFRDRVVANTSSTTTGEVSKEENNKEENNNEIEKSNKSETNKSLINKSHRRISCVMLILTSLVIGVLSYVYTVYFGVSTVYFLLHARAFELLVGGVLALFIVAREEFDLSFVVNSGWQQVAVIILRNFFGLLGLFFMLDASLSHDLLMRFAFYEAEPENDVKLSKIVEAILGAFMFIAAGTPDRKKKTNENSSSTTTEANSTTTVANSTTTEANSTQYYSLPFHFMAHDFFVKNGLLSYSLYLWHFPIIVIARYHNVLNYYEDVQIVTVGLIIIFLTYIGAFCTYRFVETPLRFKKIWSFRDIYECIVLKNQSSSTRRSARSTHTTRGVVTRQSIQTQEESQAESEADQNFFKTFFQGELRMGLFIYVLTPLAFFGILTLILYGVIPERYHSLNVLPQTAYENRWGKHVFQSRGLMHSAENVMTWEEWKKMSLGERKAFLIEEFPTNKKLVSKKIVGISTIAIGDSHLDLGFWEVLLRNSGRKGIGIVISFEEWYDTELIKNKIQATIDSIKETHLAILETNESINPADFSIDFLTATGCWHGFDRIENRMHPLAYEENRVRVRNVHDATYLINTFDGNFESLKDMMKELSRFFRDAAEITNTQIFGSNMMTKPKFMIEYDNPELLGSVMPWCGISAIDLNILNDCEVDLDANLQLFSKVTKMLQELKSEDDDVIIIPSMYLREMCSNTRPDVDSTIPDVGSAITDVSSTVKNSLTGRKCYPWIEATVNPTRKATHVFDYDQRFGPDSGEIIKIPVYRGDSDHATAVSWEWMAYRLIEVYGNPLQSTTPAGIQAYNAEDMFYGSERDW